jgi:transposase-like protein
VREDSLIDYRNPGIALPVSDTLTEVLRRGAGTLLQEAIEAEVAEVIARYQALKDERGRQGAAGLSPATISRLKEVWKEEHERWSKRELAGKHFVYIWADGVHFAVRLEDASQCILVVIGATVDGKKELVAMLDGYRESAESWKELLLDLKQRGLTVDPSVAIGDGVLGFWKALPQVFGTTREQRCWVHKTANVLNKLPKAQQAKAKAVLHEILMAESRAHSDLQLKTHRRSWDSSTQSEPTLLTSPSFENARFFYLPSVQNHSK